MGYRYLLYRFFIVGGFRNNALQTQVRRHQPGSTLDDHSAHQPQVDS
jgi:hypothetical protein